MKKGLLLLNLGTPDSPEPEAVGRYLTEFLGDPYVIDIPAVFRWVLVHRLIVPRRKHAASKLYRKIWTSRGSPLLVHTADLAKKVQTRMAATRVAFCMRYGNPSIEDALESLRGVEELTVFPLYPQYSLAATESSIDAVRRLANRILPNIRIEFVPAFFDRPEYLGAVATVSAAELKKFDWDHVLFSYHGLPERQVKKARYNYRDQCFETSKLLAGRLGLQPEQYSVAFQSRLKGSPWIRPFSDGFYEQAPSKGIKRLAVLSPSFVADCLETLEEIAIRGKAQFQKAGGEDLRLIASLNSEDLWADAVVALAIDPKRRQK